MLGLGNPLMADDGAGIRVIELLWQATLPPDVKIKDGGTAGVGLIPEMENFDKVIFVDCAAMGLQPGEWRRFTLDEAQLLELGRVDELEHSVRDVYVVPEGITNRAIEIAIQVPQYSILYIHVPPIYSNR